MFSETLNFLAAELNGYFEDKMLQGADPRVKIGNVARALDGSLTHNDSLDDKLILTLVNLEEDRAMRRHESVVKVDGMARYKRPPLLLNLYVLVSANKGDYGTSLTQLGYVVQFFQFQNCFTHSTHPTLDARIEKLLVELYTLNFEQVNHLWSTLGGKYLPSVLYKIQQLSLDENVVIGEAGLIQEILLDGATLRAT